MAGTIIDAYRAAFLQEELALDENDISEIISRTSFHLHEKLNNCVKRLQMNLVMSGETEGIVNDILNDANEGLHVYVSAMQLTSKEDVQGTSEPTFSFVADKT